MNTLNNRGFKTEETDAYSKAALQHVRKGKSLFITGKAGTGKTTLLKKLYNDFKKRGMNAIILAPTGVAAKNAGGVTIPSFFRFPIKPYIPGKTDFELFKAPHETIELIRKLHLIIIDEISMVRCDILDMVNDALRFYRRISL